MERSRQRKKQKLKREENQKLLTNQKEKMIDFMVYLIRRSLIQVLNLKNIKNTCCHLI